MNTFNPRLFVPRKCVHTFIAPIYILNMILRVAYLSMNTNRATNDFLQLKRAVNRPSFSPSCFVALVLLQENNESRSLMDAKQRYAHLVISIYTTML